MSKRKKYAPRTPLPLADGLRAQTSLRVTQSTWWVHAWYSALPALISDARLGRGRTYAQSGQIQNMTLAMGRLHATVQGGSATPYLVEIALRPLSAEAQAIVARHLTLATRARLAINDLPYTLQADLLRHGYSLIPQTPEDLLANCSCPDWARPCKHIAAVLYLFGENLTADPRKLLTLNAIDLEAYPIAPDPTDIVDTAFIASPQASRLLQPDAAIIRRLGPLPTWRSQENFQLAMTQAYSRARQKAQEYLTNHLVDFRTAADKPLPENAHLKLKRYRLGFD